MFALESADEGLPITGAQCARTLAWSHRAETERHVTPSAATSCCHGRRAEIRHFAAVMTHQSDMRSRSRSHGRATGRRVGNLPVNSEVLHGPAIGREIPSRLPAHPPRATNLRRGARGRTFDQLGWTGVKMRITDGPRFAHR